MLLLTKKIINCFGRVGHGQKMRNKHILYVLFECLVYCVYMADRFKLFRVIYIE